MRATCKQSLQVARREVTATVVPVAPQKRGTLTETEQARIRAALDAHDATYAELKAAVQAASKRGASVRELATFTGMSTNTISRWRAET